MPEFLSSLQVQAKDRGYQNERAMLLDYYQTREMSLMEIVAELNVSYATLVRRFDDHKIPRRKRNQPRKKAK